MRHIYIVNGCTEYEGDRPIMAFERRENADAYCLSLNEYRKLHPPIPHDWDDASEAVYHAAVAVWASKHPAPGHSEYMWYEVDEVPMAPPA